MSDIICQEDIDALMSTNVDEVKYSIAIMRRILNNVRSKGSITLKEIDALDSNLVTVDNKLYGRNIKGHEEFILTSIIDKLNDCSYIQFHDLSMCVTKEFSDVVININGIELHLKYASTLNDMISDATIGIIEKDLLKELIEDISIGVMKGLTANDMDYKDSKLVKAYRTYVKGKELEDTELMFYIKAG